MPIGVPKNIVTVEGWEEIKKALEDIPKRTGQAAQRRVLMKRAAPIVAEAKRIAPEYSGKDPRVPVGYLKNSIQASTKRPRNYKSESDRAFAKELAMTGSLSGARAAAKEAGRSPVVVFIGPSIGPGRRHLDWWNEFGNSQRPAHPYLRPAMDLLRGATINGIGADMMAEIKAAAARAEKKRAKSGR